jgi:hypothetical protein
MSIKMSSSSVSNPAQTLTFYETTQCEYSIASFIETYQNELPRLVMIKKGYLGDTDSNSLDTDQVISLSLSLSLCMYSFKMQHMT